ncbi:MAG: hypothetical protein CR986_01355 [Ignavibacteriae bacterium]|nr:MAG: hypothetical protein CR986_01355 [Ignavibacteriota bacterium]
MIKKNHKKVLIIDDNSSILNYLKTILGKYYFEVKTCTNGYDGLQNTAEFKPDIVFLDLMMPNIDGIQLLQLKKVLNDIKDIPVIVISANAGRKNVISAMEAGADRVLSKPIDFKQLKTAVNELLEGSFFDVVKTDIEIKEDKRIEDNKNFFKEKFEEFKDIILDGINNRDQDAIKKTAVFLQKYSKSFDNTANLILLKEIENKDYRRPSDWLFAELKIKEIDQNLKVI